MRWSQTIFIIIVILITLAALWLLVSSSVPRPDQDGPDQAPPISIDSGLKVGVSIPPLQSMVESIGGDKVASIVLLPPGGSPHTFEPKISEMTRLQGARSIFVIGHGLDDWAWEMVADTASVIVVDEGIELRASREGDSHSTEDPHYWLSFDNCRQIARNIANELQALDPDNAGFYEKNLEKLDEEISSAKKESQAILAGIKKNRIVTFHDAWEYFAAEMGLEVAATFEPDAGKEPTPQYLAELQKAIRQNGINAIFSEPQFSAEVLSALLNDLGIQVRDLDPMGSGQAGDFFETMVRNSQVIAETLK